MLVIQQGIVIEAVPGTMEHGYPDIRRDAGTLYSCTPGFHAEGIANDRLLHVGCI